MHRDGLGQEKVIDFFLRSYMNEAVVKMWILLVKVCKLSV